MGVEADRVHDSRFEDIEIVAACCRVAEKSFFRNCHSAVWDECSELSSGRYSNLILVECGWGLGVSADRMEISNCTLYDTNVAYGLSASAPTEVSITNYIIWGQESLGNGLLPSYSCVEGLLVGEGNTSAEPQFVDAANGDFRLLPTSPCIDAGKAVDGVAEDFDGNLRPYDALDAARGDGSDFDMGAFEFIGEATEPEGEGDEGEGIPRDPHWAPIEDDRDEDLLTDAEEEALGFDPDDPDQNGNGYPDGHDLARRVSHKMSLLPVDGEGDEGEVADDVMLYVSIEHCDCQFICPMDGDVFDEVIGVRNRRLDVAFGLYGLHRHFVYHGSFSTYLVSNPERLDPIRACRVLEINPLSAIGLADEGEAEGIPEDGEPQPEGAAIEAEPEGEPEPEAEPEAEFTPIEAEPGEAEPDGEPEPEAESSSEGESPEAESPDGEIEGEAKPVKFLNCAGTSGALAVAGGIGAVGDLSVLLLMVLAMGWRVRRTDAA